MGLVLEHHEPVFLFAVYLCLYLDAACIDLFGFVKIICLAVLLQILGSYACHVHEAEVLVPVSVNIAAHVHISCKSFADDVPVRTFLEAYILQCSVESGVPAVVGPVSVDDFELRQRRIALLVITVVLLHEFYIFGAHGESHVFSVFFKFIRCVSCKTGYDGNVFRNCGLHFEIFRFLC